MRKYLPAFVVTGCIALALFAQSKPLGAPLNDPRKDGYVPDEKVARAIAAVILNSMYGERYVSALGPYSARLEGGELWIVTSAVVRDPSRKGGTLEVRLAKKDGKIVDVISWK